MPPPGFVLDASVALAWGYEDECEGYADSIEAALSDKSAIAPSLWRWEIANSLLMNEKRGRIKPARTALFLDALGMLPIEIDEAARSSVWNDIMALGRIHCLTAYDATYLELALRRNLPLATLDKPLAKAAKKCGVEIFKP